MKQKFRDPYFDNAKFLLMVFVVFGHLLQPFIEQTAWSKNLYFSIYTFHMPAFILISGYFAKSFDYKKADQVRMSFQKFILPYLFFQWIYTFFYWLTGARESFSFQLHIPNWSLWFLISSFFWQVSLYFFQKVPPKVGIIISILLSLLVGYIPFLNRELTLQRTFVFLPFFVIGYYLKPEAVEKFRQWQYKKFLGFGFLVIYAVIQMVDIWDKYMFFGSKPYEDFLNFPEWGGFVRIVTFLLAWVGILAFFALVPAKHKPYTENGRYTLVAYLLHGFIVQGLRGLNVQSLPFNALTAIIVLVGSIVLTFVLSSEPVGELYASIEQTLLGYNHKPKKKITLHNQN